MILRVAVQRLIDPVPHILSANRFKGATAIDSEMTSCRACRPARDQRVEASAWTAISREDIPGARIVVAPFSDGHAAARSGRVRASVSMDGTEGARVSEPAVGSPPVVRVVTVLLSFAEGRSDRAAFNIRQACEERLKMILGICTALPLDMCSGAKTGGLVYNFVGFAI